MTLNLCPPSVVQRTEFAKRRPFLIAAAACFVFALLAWGAFYARVAHALRNRAARTEEKISGLKRIEGELNEVRKKIAALDDCAVPLITAINDRGFWLRILEELNAQLPKENIWITELVGTSGGTPLATGDSRVAGEDALSPPSSSPARTYRSRHDAFLDRLLVRGLYLFNPKQQEVVVEYFRNLAGSGCFAIDTNNQAKVLKPSTPNETEWAYPYELHLELRQPLQMP